MKFSGDSSIIVRLYVPQSDSRSIEEFLTDGNKVLSISELARTEVVNVLCREEVSLDPLDSDLKAGTRLRMEPVNWAAAFRQAESLARRFSRFLRPGGHDLMIVAASITFGATWFLSLDTISKQRALASAAGLKVWPPLTREEKGLVHSAMRRLGK